MARESKAEREVRELIAANLELSETLREFTRGATQSTSAAWFFFGAIGAAIARRNQLGYYVGLTNKRLILLEVKGKSPTGNVQSIPVADIKGLRYSKGLYSGSLNIHLTADTMKLNFDSRPWYPRAQQMAKLLPLPR
jgi:hypothetical protein